MIYFKFFREVNLILIEELNFYLNSIAVDLVLTLLRTQKSSKLEKMTLELKYKLE